MTISTQGPPSSATIEAQERDAVIRQRLQDAHDYAQRTNDLVGLFGFTMGVACVSTENPRFYGALSFALLIFAWSSLQHTYGKRLRLLREIGHPDLKPYALQRRMRIGLIGYTFLFAVTMGYFDKSGLNLEKKTLAFPLSTAAAK
jgi:hypothetical protein